MTTVAFLASAVDPQVAAEAARAAITEFTKQQYDVPNHLKNAHVDQVMKHKAETGKSDPEFGLDKSGIAGYKTESTEKEGNDKEDESMEVDKPADEGIFVDIFIMSPNISAEFCDIRKKIGDR